MAPVGGRGSGTGHLGEAPVSRPGAWRRRPAPGTACGTGAAGIAGRPASEPTPVSACAARARGRSATRRGAGAPGRTAARPRAPPRRQRSCGNPAAPTSRRGHVGRGHVVAGGRPGGPVPASPSIPRASIGQKRRGVTWRERARDASLFQSGRTPGPTPASLSLQGALRRPPRGHLKDSGTLPTEGGSASGGPRPT